MQELVDVAVPIGVDRTFTYRVPEELRGAVAVGKRVIVPLGRKVVTGLIIGLPATSPYTSLKNVLDVLDPSPVVPEELFRLCLWVAEYYQAPVAEVFKAALPHGFSPPGKSRVRAALPADDPRVRELLRGASRRHALFSLLVASGPCTMADLARRAHVRSVNALVHLMAADGLVVVEELAPRSLTRPRTEVVLPLAGLDLALLSRHLDDLPPRQRKIRDLGAAVLAAHASGRAELPAAEALRSSGATSAHLRALVAARVVGAEQRVRSARSPYGSEQRTLELTLNEAQERVLASVVRSLSEPAPHPLLLHGVTGSGKTQVYIEAIRRCLALGRTAIVLVPEISLTPQIVRRFTAHFGDAAVVVHSRMAAGERVSVWRQALAGGCRIVIGPRSAVFAPLPHLGLLVVDEEHESSYKQYDALPRYHARDVAIMRGREAGATVLLGSATPSLESYANALAGKYGLLEMTDRIDHVPMPPIAIIDMTAERKGMYAAAKDALPREERGKLKEFRMPALSRLLQERITDRLAKGEGIILLQNRRGYAPFVECEECGIAETCTDCSVTMTYHQTKRHLRCHYCGAVRPAPLLCPSCGAPAMRLRGLGTQKVEEELQTAFPTARIVRMDLDTTAGKGAHDRLLRQFGERKADILLGTQMVAKGLDFPHVTLVGVISADTQMLLPDFRASERTFQLLTQVAGRAGRSTLLGEVIIQTHQPAHYVLRHVLRHAYREFYDEEIAVRRELSYPPASRLVLLEFRGEKEEAVAAAAERVGALLSHEVARERVLGPSPAVLSRLKKQYRWHVLVKADRGEDPSGARVREAVRRTLAAAGGTRQQGVQITVDVDPAGTL